MKNTILKVLTGSRAHGLHRPDSDYDFRGVYVTPTSEILSLFHKYKGTQWLEGTEDNTSYELGHFLQLAVKSNPTILEVFMAPVEECNELGKELKELFPYVWNPKNAFDAFTGYGFNQRKKFLENKDDRSDKFAIAWIRTLHNLSDLLETGAFKLEVTDAVLKAHLTTYQSGNYSLGQVVDTAEYYYHKCVLLLSRCKHEGNVDKVNEFLLKVRKSNW